MKKLFVLVGLIAVSIMGSDLAWAKENAASEAAAEKRAKIRKLIEEKKAEINGSEWKVKMTSSDGTGKSEEDVWTFQNNKVSSKVLTGRGFQPTNYTITADEGSPTTVWETMQTSAKEGVVFIRGEWSKDTMRGVVSEQLEGGKTRDYNFTTAGRTTVAPTKEEPKKEEPKVEPKKEEPAPAAPKVEEAPMPAQQAAAPQAPKQEVKKATVKKRWGF